MRSHDKRSSRLPLPPDDWRLPYRHDRWTFDRTRGQMVVVCVPRRWHPRWWLWQVNATVATVIQMLSGNRFQASWLVGNEEARDGR